MGWGSLEVGHLPGTGLDIEDLGIKQEQLNYRRALLLQQDAIPSGT